MTTLTEQMEGISYQLLTGQITQEEALQKQRDLLGQPVPTPATAEEPSTIALSVETKAAQAIARYHAKQADAAAKYDESGGAVGAAETVAPGVRLYKLTQNGLALQATIQGTKYWKDEELNKH